MTVESKIGVLSNTLEHIEASISGMNKNVNIILEKLNQQNGDLIKAEKDIGFIKDEIKEIKAEHEKKIKELKETQEKSKSKIWEEIRRRDEAQDEKSKQREVRQRWVIGTIISLGFLGMVILKYFG